MSHLVEMDRIVLVDGKVDSQESDRKILVDAITTEFSRVVAVEEPSQQASSWERKPPSGMPSCSTEERFKKNSFNSIKPGNQSGESGAWD